MERREALRLLGGVSVFSALSADWLGATLSAEVAQQSPGTLQTLTPAQNDIVVAMSEALIPATDTPGAKGARVNEFWRKPTAAPTNYLATALLPPPPKNKRPSLRSLTMSWRSPALGKNTNGMGSGRSEKRLPFLNRCAG